MSEKDGTFSYESIFPDNFLENQLQHRPLCISDENDDVPHSRSPYLFPGPRKRRSGFLRRIEGWIIDSWLLEIAALMMAMASLAGIFITLGQYNGRALMDWHHSFSINPVLAILATVMKATTLLAVAAAMGQLKWTWYHQQKQPLQDFQVFDAASRGPLGAAWMLYRIRSWHLASMGAAITLIALASDTFVQASVALPLRITTSADVASIPVARKYSVAEGVASSMKAALYDGLLSANQGTLLSTLVAQCPTGNCTFPPYATMEICSECRNLTSVLSITENETEWGEGVYRATLELDDSTDLELNAGKGMMYFMNMTATSYTPSSNMKGDVSIANVSMVTFDGSTSRNTDYDSGTPARFRAYNCNLSICGRIFTASVVGGNFTEMSNVSYSTDWVICRDQPGCLYGNGTVSTSMPALSPESSSSTTLSITNNSISSLSSYLAGYQRAGGLLNGYGFGAPAQDPPGVISWSNDIILNIWVNGVDNIPRTFAHIATSMTNSMRTSSITADTVAGTVQATQSYIHVRWPWMALPAVMVVGAAVFVGLVSYRSWKWGIPSWRTSALAGMVHGLHVEAAAANHNNNNNSSNNNNKERWGGTGGGVIAGGPGGAGAAGVVWGVVGGVGDGGGTAGKEMLSDLADWAEGILVRLRRRGRSGKEFGLVETGSYGRG